MLSTPLSCRLPFFLFCFHCLPLLPILQYRQATHSGRQLAHLHLCLCLSAGWRPSHILGNWYVHPSFLLFTLLSHCLPFFLFHSHRLSLLLILQYQQATCSGRRLAHLHLHFHPSTGQCPLHINWYVCLSFSLSVTLPDFSTPAGRPFGLSTGPSPPPPPSPSRPTSTTCPQRLVRPFFLIVRHPAGRLPIHRPISASVSASTSQPTDVNHMSRRPVSSFYLIVCLPS